MSAIKELFPHVFQWKKFSEEKKINFNGHLVCHQGEAVIIDPPELSEKGLGELNSKLNQGKGHTLKAILLTNIHHDRFSLKLKEYFEVPIYIHETDAKGLDVPPDKTFKDGDTLFCGFKAIQLQDQKSPGETAFFLESEKLLVVGDALIGKVPGKVDLLPAEKYKDLDQAKQSLKVLLKWNFDKLLVGDGESILEGAMSCVESFLNA